MRIISGRCVLLGSIISVLVIGTILQYGNSIYQQIAYQRWFSLKLFHKLNNTLETVPNIVSSGTQYNTSDNGICGVSSSTPHKKTSANDNTTFYITSRNINRGRLGNKMFKYASLLGIARRQGRHMFIKPDRELGETFKLHYEVVIDEAKWRTIQEANPFSFNIKLMNLPLQNLRIDGYLQSFCYFAEIMDEVRQEFTFQDPIAVAAANLLRDVSVKHNDSIIVAVHARRGDFLRMRQQKLGYGVPDRSYFIKAFSLMKSKFPGRNITFVVVSDDLRWCKENLSGEDVIIMPPESPGVHLAVLSSCDHVIISGGTFGWWAGWLANGYVVYYTGFTVKGSPIGNQMKEQHYYPRQWIGLEN